MTAFGNDAGESLLLCVLGTAREGFSGSLEYVRGIAGDAGKKNSGVLLRDAWILTLYRAFVAAYEHRPLVKVFAKPLKSDRKAPYRRGEYGFDLAVIEMGDRSAPYHKTKGDPTRVPVVTRHLWQIESEMAANARSVAEDLGKLMGGVAPYKLLVVRRPERADRARWLDFIHGASQGISGQLYLVVLRGYGGAKGGLSWKDGVPELHSYRRGNEGAFIPLPLGPGPVSEAGSA